MKIMKTIFLYFCVFLISYLFIHLKVKIVDLDSHYSIYQNHRIKKMSNEKNKTR